MKKTIFLLCGLMAAVLSSSAAEGRVFALATAGDLEPGFTARVVDYLEVQTGAVLRPTDPVAADAAESLEEMGEVAVPHLLEALPEANDAGREALLALLSRFPGDARIYDGLIDLFHRYPVRQAVLAAYLGRLGDVRAIDALRARALDAHTGYLDFIELRSAIEQLGGEAPEREFDEDPEYEALFGTGQ